MCVTYQILFEFAVVIPECFIQEFPYAGFSYSHVLAITQASECQGSWLLKVDMIRYLALLQVK